MRLRNSSRLGLAAIAAACSSAVLASGSTGGTVAVSAQVQKNCTVNSPTLTFAAVDPTAGANSTGTAVLTVTCTKGTTLLDIKLDPGSHQIAGGSRQMNNGSVNVKYALYTDPGYSILWGDGSAGIGSALSSGFSAFSGVAVPQNFNVYGQVLAADADVQAGTYSDSVGITVDF